MLPHSAMFPSVVLPAFRVKMDERGRERPRSEEGCSPTGVPGRRFTFFLPGPLADSAGRANDGSFPGGSAALPRCHMTHRQKRLFMIQKKTDIIAMAAAKTGFRRVTGYRLAAHPLVIPREEAAGWAHAIPPTVR